MADFPILTKGTSIVNLAALRGHLEKGHADPFSALGILTSVHIIHQPLPKIKETIPLSYTQQKDTGVSPTLAACSAVN